MLHLKSSVIQKVCFWYEIKQLKWRTTICLHFYLEKKRHLINYLFPSIVNGKNFCFFTKHVGKNKILAEKVIQFFFLPIQIPEVWYLPIQEKAVLNWLKCFFLKNNTDIHVLNYKFIWYLCASTIKCSNSLTSLVNNVKTTQLSVQLGV